MFDVEEGAMTRGSPERIPLDAAGTDHVLRAVANRGWRCTGCGGDRARVGEVLDLRLLFPQGGSDAYLVALCCCNATCSQPRDDIRLGKHEFAADAGTAAGGAPG